MKHSNKFFFLILFSIFILIPIGSFTPSVTASNTTYISATDIIKNFKFTTFDGKDIVDEGVYNNKLRFDTQASWVLYKNDMMFVSKYESGDSTFLRYKMRVRNKINIYTNIKLSDISSDISKRYGKYLGVYYKHMNLGQLSSTIWEQYVTWEHYDFGDIKTYNTQNNIFGGRLKMTFDIDSNPMPESIGANTETEFGYITVDSAGVITSSWGKMSDDMPSIIKLDPSEVESEFNDNFDEGTAGVEAINLDLEPNTHIIVWEDPTESFDGGIQAETSGSSLNPTNKDGSDIWDPNEERSMTGCELNYDLVKLSPLVLKWQGRLDYTSHDVLIEDVLGAWFKVVPVLKHHWLTDNTVYGDVALHGINRYIQSDIYVDFDVWTSVKVGVLKDYYEIMKLESPIEYYDALIWSTMAGGWMGSTIKEYELPVAATPAEWLEGLLGGIGGIITLIIVIAIAGIGIYIFFVFGMPLLRTKRKLKSK